jgi:hypothetical protein
MGAILRGGRVKYSRHVAANLRGPSGGRMSEAAHVPPALQAALRRAWGRTWRDEGKREAIKQQALERREERKQ